MLLCCLQFVHSPDTLTDVVKELLEGHSEQSIAPQSQADAPHQVATDAVSQCTIDVAVDTCYNANLLNTANCTI